MPTPLQRYVATELTHFVGRALQEDPTLDTHARLEAQYSVMSAVLESTELQARGAWLGPLDERPEEFEHGIKFSPAGPEAGLNEIFTPTVVCFCDIPADDFYVHVGKYGPFGLAFDRQWLVERGANPVFYVANESRVSSMGSKPKDLDVERGPHLTQSISELLGSLQSLTHKKIAMDDVETSQTLFRAFYFIVRDVGPLLKGFSSAALDDDPESYYLEREWRVLGNLSFELADVRRVIIDRKFARRFRTDFPTYTGQLQFAT